jgi:hypothetical protein
LIIEVAQAKDGDSGEFALAAAQTRASAAEAYVVMKLNDSSRQVRVVSYGKNPPMR